MNIQICNLNMHTCTHAQIYRYICILYRHTYYRKCIHIFTLKHSHTQLLTTNTHTCIQTLPLTPNSSTYTPTITLNTHSHTFTVKHIKTHKSTQSYSSSHNNKHTYSHTLTLILDTQTYILTHKYIHIHMHTRIYMCSHTHTHAPTHKKTYPQTHIHITLTMIGSLS